MFSCLCHTSCLCSSAFEGVLGFVGVQWPEISSPCSHSPYRNASCQQPRRRRGVGLSSAPSCSHSGLLHLRKHVDSEERSQDSKESMTGERSRAEENRQRHMRGQWEETLTFLLLQHSELGGIDNSAGDLQLHSFRFQPMKPG